MSAQPATNGSFGDHMYEQVLPLAKAFVGSGQRPYSDEDNGWHLLHFIAAFSLPFELVESIARDSDEGPGYSAVVDIERCPSQWLPWLAQFRGVSLPPQLLGQSDADYDTEMRQWIKDADGYNRGSIQAIEAAARRRLVGPDGTRDTATVFISERDGGDPDQLVVTTLDAETPDPDGTLADILSQKPWGIVLNHQQTISHTWAGLIAARATWTEVLAHHPTWNHLLLNLP